MLTRQKARRAVFPALLFIAAHGVAGCGPSPNPNPQRVAVTGRVTLDGAPAPAGTIVFVPAVPGQMQAQGIISDEGTFAIAAADGPSPGDYKVEIQCAKKSGRRVASLSSTDGTGKIDERVPVVPTKYNTATVLRQTIAPGENVLEFKLQSKP